MQSAGRPRNVNPDGLAPARGFSHATVAGDTVWVGGQIGSDQTGRVVEPGDVVAQLGRAIRIVAVALRAAGCVPEDTDNLTCYVTIRRSYTENLPAIVAPYMGVTVRH